MSLLKFYDGDIEIALLDENGEEIAYGEAEERFSYIKRVMVTTLVGETYENNTKFDILDGPWGKLWRIGKDGVDGF